MKTSCRDMDEVILMKALPVSLVLSLVLIIGWGCGRIAARNESEAIASSDMIITDGRQRKIFSNWTPLQTPGGACQSRRGRLILYPDGSREWEVEVLSKDSGRAWEQAFHFYDAGTADATWFGSRLGGRFEIPYGDVWTYWRYGRGLGDRKLAEAFEKIKYVVWSAGC
jgi:hypothetical protein